MRDRQLILDGQVIHLREWGAVGLPRLVMLHGFPEYGAAWDDLAPLLADRFHCIAPDQRGYGQSAAPEEVSAYKARHLVADMAALIGALDAEAPQTAPLTVLGHDWGAAVAYGLAIARPDLVARLVILNGVHPGPFQRALNRGGAQAAASQYFHALRRDGAEEHLAADGYARLLGLFGHAMDMSWLSGARRARYLAEWSRPGRLRGMLNWYRASPIVVPEPGRTADASVPGPDHLPVTMPHLLIWGEADTALLPEATEGLEAYCTDLTRVTIPGADHWLIHQQPQRIARILRDWLPG
ncbi:alpha/beta fold hydrolase [Pseudooceanicola aestuarii]|uniref:alpha/beta fold hydrolase n=1 Tax=Pseudooceanicola aestuarii TaxID=2697319 RepID=UPI0013D4D6F2|nr:alpha/beta fold hydrolase [Pseudooceanicola aestuarii]